MDAESKCRDWFNSLDPVRRADAVDNVAHELPEWMVDSLRSAGIVVIEARRTDGDHGVHNAFLLPTALLDYLEAIRVDQP